MKNREWFDRSCFETVNVDSAEADAIKQNPTWICCSGRPLGFLLKTVSHFGPEFSRRYERWATN